MEYKDTVNLPNTDFSMKANLSQKEPQIQKKWQDEKLYLKIREKSKGKKKYVLHDGPPYANGDIHIGHSLNKILKDIVIRYKTMQSFDAAYIPGWDCHGLPVEHQLMKQLKISKKDIEQTKFRKQAHDYAMKYVDIQRQQFERLGILGQWDNPYLTLNKEYEAGVISALRELVKNGYVYKGVKPVNWCSVCQTALAEAEVEYQMHQSKSVFVKFDILLDTKKYDHKMHDAINKIKSVSDSVSVLIWTTTPWTLMSNVAVALKHDLSYSVVEVVTEKGRDYIILADLLVDKVMGICGIKEFKTITKFLGKQLEGVRCKHPFVDRESIVVNAEYISEEDGSGCVHIAPGHGEEDFAVGQKYGLDVIMPVLDYGLFDKTCGEFGGLNVLGEGNDRVIEKLNSLGKLLHQNTVEHSYPHCWRCKKPIIFRATAQWFVGVDKNNLRKETLAHIKKVDWIPESGEKRISSMLQTRPDWCLSRQRFWGIPIPAVYCKECNSEYLTTEILGNVIEIFKQEGSSSWFEKDVKDFVPKGFKCSKCSSVEFKKETDILDVWFESGASYESVVKNNKELHFPADLYLEGSDQHRGWFQSSLLISMGVLKTPPFKAVLTHGFVVDAKGCKMSKSIGNVIAPGDVVNKYGADILRLWVSSCDYHDDIRLSDEVLARCADTYRKIRNTFKYMIGNLYDYSEDKNSVEYKDLLEIDRWALAVLSELVEEVTDAYEKYEFHRVYRAVYDFCVKEMSSFYLDILKDRLYILAANSLSRRSAQTVLHKISTILVRILAPILVYTSEEIWNSLGNSQSIHLVEWQKTDRSFLDDKLKEKWSKIIQLREAVLLQLEDARTQKLIGSSLEAEVVLKVKDLDLYEILKAYEKELHFIFIVSYTKLTKSKSIKSEFSIKINKAGGSKCSRCWNYSDSVGRYSENPDICERCYNVIKGSN